MLKWKKAAATILAAAVAGSFVACGESTATAMTIDGVQIKAGMYIYYSYSAYLELTQTLQSENSDLDVTDDDVVKAQKMDNVDAETWIQNKTLEYCQQYAAIVNKAEELDVTLTDDEKTEVSDSVDTFWDSNGEIYEKNGISKESVTLILENSYLTSDVFLYYYDVDGDKGVTEDELKEYYIDNNARVRYIKFDMTDGNGDELDDSGKADLKEMVEGYLERVEDVMGDDEAMDAEMDAIDTEYDAYVTSISEEAAAETATSATDEDGNEIAATTTEAETTTEAATTTVTEAETTAEDTAETTVTAGDDSTAETTTTAAADSEVAETTVSGETTTVADESDEETTESGETTTTTSPYANESIIAKVTTDEDTDEEDVTYTPSEKAYNYIFDEAELGVPAIVEDDDAYYLILRMDIEDRMTSDDLWTDDQIETVIYDKYTDDFKDMRDEWCAAQTVDKNDRAIKRYDAFDIDMDSSST